MNIASLKESYISVKEAMEHIPYSYDKILKLVKSGQLPALRLDNRIFVLKADAETYVQNNIKTFSKAGEVHNA